jgi:predicted ribosome quality control (RQC) complex YloA/Tae2 family protein
MAKTSTSTAVKDRPEPQVRQDKEQKKQAKREAKLKARIEFLQKSIQKAERKASRANADADTLRAQLHELNEQLNGSHAPSNQQEVEPDTIEYVEEAIAELHQASLPPVEGRNDINGSAPPSSVDTTTEPTQEFAEQTPSFEEAHTSPVSEGTEPTQEFAEQTPSSEEAHTSPVSEGTEPTQESAEQTPSSEEAHTSPSPAKRSRKRAR